PLPPISPSPRLPFLMHRNHAHTRPDLGHQRLWIWRGWRIRYTYLMPDNPEAQTATPLLLVHGFGASLEQWRHNLRALSHQRPVYALDLLGFGGSQKPAAMLGAKVWQAQVFEFWQTVIGQPVILMGHSLGALVALTSAAGHPQMVKRLIMLTLPLARQELVSGWLDRLSRGVESVFVSPLLLRPLFQVVRRPWFLRAVLRKVYRQPERVDDDLVAAFARPTGDRGAARTLCYLVRSRTTADFSPTTHDLIEQLQIPILLLWGTEDTVIPIRWAEQIVPLNPQLTFQAIENAGHCLYDELPEALHGAIADWL
ncbi:MAG: alpha/beta fold hydrolase, partial [Cyanobacteria bacterium J06635_1]